MNTAHPNSTKLDKIEDKINEDDNFNEDDFYDDDPAFDDYNDGDFSDFQDNNPAFSDYNDSANDEYDIDRFQPPMDDLKLPNNSTIKAATPIFLKNAQQQIDKKVASLSEQLNVPQNHSLLLLRRHKWNSSKILELYLDETQTKIMFIDAGICVNPISDKDIKTQRSNTTSIECSICLDDVDTNKTFNIECGHNNVCTQCWIDYLRTAVKTKHCINLTCPQHKCHVIIQSKTWKTLISDKHRTEYQRYLRFCTEHFIEHSKCFIFCPGKGCDMIYKSEIGIAQEIWCISCLYRFCCRCQYESHFPATCDIGSKWITKCCSESENIAWILAKTKKCPKCRIHIEKSQGCNHMTCRPHVGGCGHEFCWLCKGDWSTHNSSTGGYYQCNIYEDNKAKGVIETEQKIQTDAVNELERYEFHYTRFDSHNASCAHAVKQKETIGMRMHELADKFKWRLNEAQFLDDAVNEATQCWRVLAWTYPVSYYGKDEAIFNLDLFAEQQRKLESFCDGLQEKLDFDLQKLGDIKVRQSVIDFTRAANKYRNNMVRYIESVLF